MAHGLKFDREQFAADCAAANAGTDGMLAVREVLTRAVSDPGAVRAGLGEPTEAAMNVLHRSPSLTIFAATWTPRMTLRPHDHNMWALIGIYSGREDNILWRQTEGGLEARGANCLFEGDVATLGKDAIHSVTNPLTRFTGGLHIYGGDFFATERHQWDPETLEQQPSNGDVIRAIFAEENARYLSGLPSR
jgi:predicted metal-dependent enzyme (double-stranded beta helix superfamily)